MQNTFHVDDKVEFDVDFLFEGKVKKIALPAIITNIYQSTARIIYWNFFDEIFVYRELDITELRLGPDQEPRRTPPPIIVYSADNYFMVREDNRVFSAAVTLDLSQSTTETVDANLAYGHAKISGPACTFDNSRAPISHVTLSDAGTYIFQGIVTDLVTRLSASQQLTVTVKAKIPGLVFNNNDTSIYVSTLP